MSYSNIEQYKQKIKDIDTHAEIEKRKIAKEFAIANNQVAVGDIVKDHIGTIKVEKIDTYLSNPPQCVYTGAEYTKDGKPKKNGKKRTVYQSNLKT